MRRRPGLRGLAAEYGADGIPVRVGGEAHRLPDAPEGCQQAGAIGGDDKVAGHRER